MQACECQLPLRLGPDGDELLPALGDSSTPRSLEKNRLADSRFATEQERTTPLGESIDQRIDDRRFRVASDEFGPGHGRRIGPWRSADASSALQGGPPRAPAGA